MTEQEWKLFFELASTDIGAGEWNIQFSKSWCLWTTFARLSLDSGYWQAGLPKITDIGESGIGDGGVWGQPFKYSDLAHIIIPVRFTTETGDVRNQNIAALYERLCKVGIKSRLTETLLEIKLY